MMDRIRKLLAPWSQPLRRLRRPSLFGMRSVKPLSTEWGFDRGTPVDRYYIEQFLETHAADVRGRALEVKSAAYTHRFDRGVTQFDILDVDAHNPDATIVADLAVGDGIPRGQFDCFILTQTLHIIYDYRAAIAQSHSLLKPGGVLLVTVPLVSRIIPRYGLECDYWRFTALACARMFGEVFGAENVGVCTYGNVLAGIAFLRGAVLEELPRRKLDVHDPYFPIVVGVRATKAPSSPPAR
ncbi:MAG: methyltransferase domain-containing protein [Gemmatimonadaceae bacterium]